MAVSRRVKLIFRLQYESSVFSPHQNNIIFSWHFFYLFISRGMSSSLHDETDILVSSEVLPFYQRGFTFLQPRQTAAPSSERSYLPLIVQFFFLPRGKLPQPLLRGLTLSIKATSTISVPGYLTHPLKSNVSSPSERPYLTFH